jgi:DNA replicative helicase MCM subunit Mcm2 (Cdc46/Mcm family)
VLTYILCCLYKIKLTPAAAAKLADCYRDLRQGDNQGVGRSSYRITVRQLVRLSEAIARVYCREEVGIIKKRRMHNYALLKKKYMHTIL